MSDLGFTLLETAIGHCGIVWSERGVAGVQLPERNAPATRNRILRRFAGAREAVPPDVVQRAIADIVALLGGEPRDLTHVTIDTDGMADLNRRVYAIARTIPPGRRCHTAKSPRGSAIEIWRATSVRRLGKIRFRSSCPVIACWRRAARSAASPRRAAS